MSENKRFLNMERKERTLVLVLGFVLLANALAMQISGIVAVSGFLSEGGVNQMLLVLFVDYALILVIGSLVTLVIDKFDRIDLIQWVALMFALLFLALRIMFMFNAPGWLNYSLMYILAEQQYVVFPMVFWVLANDIFKLSQAKRLFPLISGFSFAGKLLGIGVAAAAPTLFVNLDLKPEDILNLNVLVYLLAYIFLITGLRNVEVRKTVHKTESLVETLREGWAFILDVPSFRYVMHALVALAVADTVIEFRFLVVTDQAFPSQADYQTFFSLYRLGTTLVAMLIQALVTGYVIKHMQIKNTFLFFPIVALAGAIGMIFVPGVSMAVGVMIAVKLVRDTVSESGRKNFQGLVPEERRGRVVTVMESYFPAIGTMLACVLAGAIVYMGEYLGMDVTLYYIILAALGGFYALGAILRMLKVYDSSLFNWRLKRRQRRARTVLLDKLTD